MIPPEKITVETDTTAGSKKKKRNRKSLSGSSSKKIPKSFIDIFDSDIEENGTEHENPPTKHTPIYDEDDDYAAVSEVTNWNPLEAMKTDFNDNIIIEKSRSLSTVELWKLIVPKYFQTVSLEQLSDLVRPLEASDSALFLPHKVPPSNNLESVFCPHAYERSRSTKVKFVILPKINGEIEWFQDIDVGKRAVVCDDCMHCIGKSLSDESLGWVVHEDADHAKLFASFLASRMNLKSPPVLSNTAQYLLPSRSPASLHDMYSADDLSLKTRWLATGDINVLLSQSNKSVGLLFKLGHSSLELADAQAIQTKLFPDEIEATDDFSRELISTQNELLATIDHNNYYANNIVSYVDGERSMEVEDFNINKKYWQYKTLKLVMCALAKGVDDKYAGFNKYADVEVPKSWLIATEGRPAAEVDPVANQDDEDDAICLVCFFGESTETNPIIFCDCCNIAVHQACYGIKEIPEGDFFCDRCVAVKQKDVSPTCVFCPHRDGAFKRTTDGQWAHIHCAFWTPGVLIDLDTMGNIDLRYRRNHSKPPLQFTSWDSCVEGGTDDDAVTVEYECNQTCICCNLDTGAPIKCSHPECTTYFHPLCAWYDGLFMKVTCEYTNGMLVYGGGGTGGLFEAFCFTHTPTAVLEGGKRSIMEQRNLRKKYRFKDEQEAAISKGAQASGGKRSRHTKMTNEEKDRASAAARRKEKERKNKMLLSGEILEADVYKDGVCAVCFDDVVDSDDSMAYCGDCGISLHTSCYGPLNSHSKKHNGKRRKNYEDDDGLRRDLRGLCRRCEEQLDVYDTPCALCPRVGGAMKKTTADKWVHLQCALWIPGSIIPKDEDTQLVDLSGIEKKRIDKFPCNICNKKKGAILQCMKKGCYKCFHALCGRIGGSFMEYTEVMNPATKRKEIIQEYYCAKHAPVGYRWNPDVSRWQLPKVPTELQKLYFLRGQFERARMLIDLVRRRDKLKKHIVRSDDEIFQSKIMKLENVVPPDEEGPEDVEENEPTDVAVVTSASKKRRKSVPWTKSEGVIRRSGTRSSVQTATEPNAKEWVIRKEAGDVSKKIQSVRWLESLARVAGSGGHANNIIHFDGVLAASFTDPAYNEIRQMKRSKVLEVERSERLILDMKLMDIFDAVTYITSAGFTDGDGEVNNLYEIFMYLPTPQEV